MKKFILILFVIVPGLLWAQTTITGNAKSENGETLPGVSIVLKGTTDGAITDVNGNFSIRISNLNSAELTFSFIGFETQNIALNGRSRLDIVMKQLSQVLEEVVVVGYGELRKRDITGSVTRVTETKNVARQYNTVDALLQGRAAGVQVSSNAGAPGGAISVRIRGTNSLRGNNEPLYVIDGVIINTAAEDVSDASTDANDMLSQQNGLTGLNPRDIESMEILKDASATAIYGSRGANGVVLITTKKGKSDQDKAKVEVYSTTDFSWISKKIDILSPLEYVGYQNELDILHGAGPGYLVNNGEVFNITYTTDANGVVTPVTGTTPLKQIDWQDEMYALAVSSNTGLSLSGQNKATNYYFSAGYNNTNGIVETTHIRQGDLRLNLTTDLTPKLKFENRGLLMYHKGSFANGGSRSGGTRSFTKQILSYSPIIDYTTSNNTEDLDLEVSNPYAWLTDYDDLTEEIRANIATSLEYQIIKGLKYKIQGGADYRSKDRSRWYGTEIFAGSQSNGKANYSNLTRYSYTINSILTYNKKIAGKSNLNATAAVTYDGNNLKNEIYEVSDFPVKTLRSKAPQLGQIVQQPFASLYADEEIFSMLGRVNYSIGDRFIMTGSFRADQSSKFTSGNQWGYFPSFAGAWRISEEQFMKKNGLFTNLKLRLGWGLTGNQAIGPYRTLSTYSATYYSNSGNGTILANVPSRIANKNLTWETTGQYNAGIDASVLKGKLKATLDFYYKRTKDLLQDIQLPTSTGFSSMTINRGEIENKGIELSIDGTIIDRKDFTFSAAGHISVNRSKVMNLGMSPSTIWSNGVSSEEIYYLGNNVSTGNYLKCPANIFMEGQPIGMLWGYETNGIYADQAAADAGPKYFGNPNKAGDLIFIDHSANGNIGIEDMTFIGNPNPDFTFGFDFNFRYHRFTLKALFDGVYGNEIANGYNIELGFAEDNSKNVLANAFHGAWKPDNQNGDHTRLGYTMNGRGLPDVIVEDGSYLRLNNITLGYDIPIKKSAVSNVNLYVAGRNLFYVTRYTGYAPEVTSYLFDGSIMGVDWVGTPNVTSFLFGINVTF